MVTNPSIKAGSLACPFDIDGSMYRASGDGVSQDTGFRASYRASYRDCLTKALAGLDAQTRVSVAIIQIENVYKLHAFWGHACADHLVNEFANRLALALGDGGAIARFGRAELGVFHLDAPDKMTCPTVLPDAISTVARKGCVWDKVSHALIVRAGISLAPQHGRSAQDLLAAADTALAHARANGTRACTICVFEPGMTDRFTDRRALEKQVASAVKTRAIALAYQPQISLSDGRVVGVEALARWPDTGGGAIRPSAFLPVIRRLSLGSDFGWMLIDRLIADMADIAPGPELVFGFNLEQEQLDAPDFLDVLERRLRHAGIAPRQIELEITENIAAGFETGLIDLLTRARDMGFRVALDDFGTGFASLSHLRSLPFDRLKIDRSFVQDIDNDLHGRAITRALIDIARAIGVELVAEGVENDTELGVLGDLGITIVQGKHLSDALGPGALIRFLQSRRG